MDLLTDLKKRAKKKQHRILFPEGDDVRVLLAARKLKDEKIVRPVILCGDKTFDLLKKNNISFDDLEIVEFVDVDKYAKLLFKLRSRKGLSLADAKKLVLDKNYLGALMLHDGFVDGVVSGSLSATAKVIRPALQIIKTKKGIKTASSFFILMKGDETYFFSDCAFVINPSSVELKDIAISTASSAKSFGFKPRVALLSFSTKGSAVHESLSKITEALSLIKREAPRLVVDGELQLDAAIVPSVAKLKCPSSKLKGDANILIFPDLNSGNISYKLVQRLGGYLAVGPIIQGLKKPVNDLSRGCSVDDIVNVAMITSLEVVK